jgi:predicted transcriptional regulator of viral defense system
MKEENINQIKPLSQKQMEIIAWLEFYQKYFFTIKDIEQFFKNKKQQYNILQRLIQKKRVIKLNREKYYLIPIKAKTGGWTQDPFILADEIFNGKDYFIGGWSAANYWNLTDQIPFRIEVFTTKRQGRKKILNTEFIFKRTTPERIKKAVIKKVNKHHFLIMNKRQMKKWSKSRQSLI